MTNFITLLFTEPIAAIAVAIVYAVLIFAGVAVVASVILTFLTFRHNRKAGIVFLAGLIFSVYMVMQGNFAFIVLFIIASIAYLVISKVHEFIKKRRSK